MSRFIVATAIALAASPAVAAESGFNPGTVVGNVYESPACAGGCGFGYSPPVYDSARLAAVHRQRRKRPIATHP
jgi:hypothetical protein